MEESAVKPVPDGASLRGESLRVGVIGTGFVGRIHARSARLSGAQLVGVAASSPQSAEAARAELGAERAFASAEELIAADGIDVVHVCTPNNLHVPLALAAVGAGKHVVCEKPIALELSGAAELAAAAAEAGVIATVPFVYRYYPTVRESRARIRAGEVGDVRLLHGGYLQDWLLAANDYNWRVEAALGGASRAFADIGSHWCDLAEFISGQRIVRLIARTAIAHERRERAEATSFERASSPGEPLAVDTEDVAVLLFETDTGATGSTVISQVSAGRKNHLWLELSTAEETLVFDQEKPDTLAVRRRAAVEEVPRDFNTLKPEAASYVTLPGGHPQGYNDCFDAFVADTYAAIVDGEAPDGLPQIEDGLRAVRLTEAVLDSASRDGWVEVNGR